LGISLPTNIILRHSAGASRSHRPRTNPESATRSGWSGNSGVATSPVGALLVAQTRASQDAPVTSTERSKHRDQRKNAPTWRTWGVRGRGPRGLPGSRVERDPAGGASDDVVVTPDQAVRVAFTAFGLANVASTSSHTGGSWPSAIASSTSTRSSASIICPLRLRGPVDQRPCSQHSLLGVTLRAGLLRAPLTLGPALPDCCAPCTSLTQHERRTVRSLAVPHHATASRSASACGVRCCLACGQVSTLTGRVFTGTGHRRATILDQPRRRRLQ
jgi:hypothetical protein